VFAADSGPSIQDAQNFYAQKDWNKAAEAYRSLNKKFDHLSPAFYFDYGTAAYLSGSLGEARVMLWKAAGGAPFDSDIRRGLASTEEKLPPEVRNLRPATWFSWWPQSAQALPWQLPFALALALLAPVLYAMATKKKAGLSGWQLSLSFVAAVVAVVGLIGLWQDRSPVAGIITNTKVASGPGASFPEITAIEAGSLVNLEETREGWAKIRYVDSRLQESVGWVESPALLKL
jgi:hypothetical protein